MLDMAKITIGEKDYLLQFPLSRMIKAEKLLGKPLQIMFSPVSQKDFLSAFNIEDLLVLFKLGMKENQPQLDGDAVESLFMDFLREGESILQQESLMYSILGKALGFFRVDLDIQQKVQEMKKEKN